MGDTEKVNAAHAVQISRLEEGANGYSDLIVGLESKVKSLTSQVNQLAAKTKDLESRQQRYNCRIIGMEEGFSEVWPEHAIATMLQDSLALNYSPALDHPHRSLKGEGGSVYSVNLYLTSRAWF